MLLKLEWLGYVWWKKLRQYFKQFSSIPERHGHRRTDGQNCYINIARQCADARQTLATVVFVLAASVCYHSNSTGIKTVTAISWFRHFQNRLTMLLGLHNLHYTVDKCARWQHPVILSGNTVSRVKWDRHGPIDTARYTASYNISNAFLQPVSASHHRRRVH